VKQLILFLSVLVGLGCLFSGCTMVGPDYKPPMAKVATQWLQFDDPRLQTNAPVDPLWWKDAFQDPVLDRLVSEALSGNLTLRSAALRVVQARQQLLIAKGTLYPQDQFIGAGAGVADPGAGGGAYGAYNLDFTLTWEIDVWGRIRRQIESASANYDASLAAHDGVLVMLIGEVAQTYFLIRTTEQRLAVNAQNIQYQEENVRISQAKLDAGDISSLDVEQGQTLLYNTRASQALLVQSVQQYKIALAILLGELPQDLSERLGKPQPVPAVSSVLAVGVPQDLIRRRPDIREAERRLAAQSAQIGYAVSDLYPRFALTGLIGPAVSTATGQEFHDLLNAESVTYNFGGVMRWSILNYGRLKSNVRLQDAKFQQLLEDYRQIVLQAQSEVERSLVAFHQSQIQLKALQLAADSAQRAADVSTEQYQEGLIDFNTVVNTLSTLVSQQDQLASIQGTVAVNLVEVFRSLGGGWEVCRSGAAGDLIPQETQKEMRERGSYWGDRVKTQ
jgi:NodT family efflux transporter outer membrane factor (OMF) lipoprotein